MVLAGRMCALQVPIPATIDRPGIQTVLLRSTPRDDAVHAPYLLREAGWDQGRLFEGLLREEIDAVYWRHLSATRSSYLLFL
jgi:hypothetical protein